MSATKLYDLDVKMGNLVPVKNMGKKWNEADNYNSIKIEDEHGGNERYVLFTDDELKSFSKVLSSLSDYLFNKIHGSNYTICSEMKYGRLYLTDTKSVTGNWVKAYLLKVRIRNKEDGQYDTTVFRIPYSKLKRAEARGKRNPEDLAVVSWFANLFD